MLSYLMKRQYLGEAPSLAVWVSAGEMTRHGFGQDTDPLALPDEESVPLKALELENVWPAVFSVWS